MMTPNLETLRTEIPEYLESRGIALFRGGRRRNADEGVVEWDCERFPDFREYVAVAEKMGVKLVIFRDHEFRETMVDAALEDMADGELPFEERREYERRLKEFRSFSGFTCAIEMVFELDGTAYVFELQTEWYREFEDLADEVGMVADDPDEEDGIGGYFSRN
jgi:hypothetical protein